MTTTSGPPRTKRAGGSITKVTIPPEKLPAYHTGPLLLRPLRIEKGVILAGVAVQPAIPRERFNIARRVEAARPQNAAELVAQGTLQGHKGGSERLVPARLVLLTCRQAWLTRGPGEVEHRGFLGRARKTVTAQAYREISADRMPVAPRAAHPAHAKLGKRALVAALHVGGEERDFTPRGEGLLRLGSQLRTQVGEHRVPAGQPHGGGSHFPGLPLLAIPHFDPAGGERISQVSDPHDGTVQSDPYGRSGLLQPRVVEVRGDDVLHGVSVSDLGDQHPHPQARDGGMPVGEMDDRRFGVFLGQSRAAQARQGGAGQAQAGKAGVPEPEAVARRNGIDAHAVQ
jgi:hypothetical protein